MRHYRNSSVSSRRHALESQHGVGIVRNEKVTIRQSALTTIPQYETSKNQATHSSFALFCNVVNWQAWIPVAWGERSIINDFCNKHSSTKRCSRFYYLLFSEEDRLNKVKKARLPRDNLQGKIWGHFRYIRYTMGLTKKSDAETGTFTSIPMDLFMSEAIPVTRCQRMYTVIRNAEDAEYS